MTKQNMARAALRVRIAAICISLIVGCQAHMPAVDPGEDCFAANGRAVPEWHEGAEPEPGVPIWCKEHITIPDPRPALSAPGACRATVSPGGGGWTSERRMRYDEQGRLVERLEGWGDSFSHHTWQYEGTRLKTYLQMRDDRVEHLQRFDEQGHLVAYEDQRGGNRIHAAHTFTRIDGTLTEIRSTFTHDDDGRTRERITRIDPETGAPAEVFEYDWDGTIEHTARTAFEAATGDFVTIRDEAGEQRESRGRCTPESRWVGLWNDVRVDPIGRPVEVTSPSGHSRYAYDAADRVVRQRSGSYGEIRTDDGFVYDPVGRLICSQRLYWSGSFDWPPLRADVPGLCAGACWFGDAVELPWNGPTMARAQMRYDAHGRLVEMALDVGADGSIEQVLEFDVAYDDQGRLVKETWLGAWSLMQAEYVYDCPAER